MARPLRLEYEKQGQIRDTVLRVSYYQEKYPESSVAIEKAFQTGAYTLKEIGDHFGKHYSTISRIVNRGE